MKLDNLTQQIQNMQQRLAQIQGCISELPSMQQQNEIMATALEELGKGLEEMITTLQLDLQECKQSEEALKASEERFRCLSACSPIGISLADVEGRCTYANPRLLALTGMTLEELLGDSWVQAVHPDERDWVFSEWFRHAQAGQEFSQEYRFQTPEGIVRWVRVQTAPMRSTQSELLGHVGTVEDITERKQAEEALRLSEKRFRLAVDNFPNGTFVIYDAQRRLQFVNANGIRLGGLPEFALLGHTDEEIHPPEITDAYLPFLQKAVETRTSQTAECTFTLPTVGKITIIVTYVPLLDERGEIYQILGITYHVTERKQAEFALKESHEFLQTVLDTNPNLIWVKDREDRIVLANQALADFFGTTVEDLLGLTNFDLHVNPVDAELCIAQDLEVITTLQQKFIPEEAFPSATGEVRWFQTIKKPLFSKDGQVYQVLGVSTDITQRKQAKRQLEESLQEKEVLLQEIHHRVKNNLQVISSLLDLQSLQIKEPTMLEIFWESQNRVKSMALVHENLYQSKNFSRVNFTDYIETLTINLFQVYAVNTDHITLEQDLDDVTLTIDTAMPCGLIINELVSNALIHAFPSKNPGKISIALHSEKDENYRLTVTDNGIGLPLDWEVKTVDSLGLQLVKILVNQIGGILQVDCRFCTEFSLRFSEKNLT